ncbi:citrate lyase holo-[acyl-carrier protein] synthase [Photobacterium sp. TY1-4]|uniref:citrate lyase holo-[acyl-carrier protein] synthase n=1 Tax=Photobacterium sp. TY1-4 TaxID=2899122 RepID=UPI0021C0F592|nr:citrate lyase holo-[acyl-carrier protein] synthase [Photobacterium sp. TY1-4]UXI02393.1 citrate lyase holo-[acyl-carrier protein] synthase [Photobacterium sp. TY1-4]
MTQTVSLSEVSLMEVLANKEARVKRQQEWLKSHSLPLISFSVNMPGPVKMSEAAMHIFNQGVDAVIDACDSHGWTIVTRQLLQEKTGPEGVFVVDAPSASLLKLAMMQVENGHPLGRLMDLDVLGADGKIISRQGSRMARRQCLLCEEDAFVCARSRRHDLQGLLGKINEMTNYG